MANFNDIKNIRIEEFNYQLPDNRIARYPLEQRDHSKLLCWNDGVISDHIFASLPDILQSETKLVFNNTKVIRARLHFRKETGAKIEIFLLDPAEPSDYAQNFQQTRECSWKCIVGNLKKWKSGMLKLPLTINSEPINLYAVNTGKSGNSNIIQFRWDKPQFTFSDILEAAGNIPIPPYLQRETEEIDNTRYQTVFSKIKGSVAAPTAGLHFTDNVLNQLRKKGITTHELTLHVGAGTFQPVKSETIDDHEMHTEHILVKKTFVKELTGHNSTIIAVGTTSIRTLESLYQIGKKVIKNPGIQPSELDIRQWDPYQNDEDISRNDALTALYSYMKKLNIEFLNTTTQIIIVPGYTFKLIDGMITNFHQPKSTLLLLISAFLGNDWKKAYAHALENDYRFLSYGDSNLYIK
ncbi:MAG: S-adenosylmethionine:tRNA ribosyltransferase-isomerase [Prolixibacteraceae bacterium]|jgi:S-adenosylmethionine:tRNA ribosyltransferase-isomerase|nr:S-adenosylmethionine:tRNA ribosyltransferase-isomerase [Prolixibacteraceae bacterium]